MESAGIWITGICLVAAVGLAWWMIRASRKQLSRQQITMDAPYQPVRIGSSVSPFFTVLRLQLVRLWVFLSNEDTSDDPGEDISNPRSLAVSGMVAEAPAPGASPVEVRYSLPSQGIRTLPIQLLTWFYSEVYLPRSRRFKFFLSLMCIAGTASLGFTFYDQSHVYGWQLATWAACVLALLVTLTPPIRIHWNRTWSWVTLLFIAALFLRISFLNLFPSGLHTDEIGVADFTLHQVFIKPNETVNPFTTGSNSQPTLFNYIIRASLYLFGNNIPALRVPGAVIGALAVVAIFAAVAVTQNRRAAFFSAILMAAYHYHIHWSRLALNNIWDTFWVPAMIAAYVWGWKKGWNGGAVLAGLALGLSQYFYAGSKIGIFLMAILILVLWFKRPTTLDRGIYLGKFLATALCVAGPILIFALLKPEPYIERTTVVWGWSEEIIRQTMNDAYDLPGYIWFQISHSIGAYFLYPDVTGFYRPGIPFLTGLAVPLFLIGIVIAFFKRQYIPLLWIGLVSFFGGFLLSGNPSSSHYITSIPAICWLVAMPLAALFDSGRRRWAVLLLAIVVSTDLYFYFHTYATLQPGDLFGVFPPLPQ